MPQAQRKTLQPLSETRRWLSAALGVIATIATILASAHSCGLMGDQSSRLSLTDLAVNWIGLSPAADTARALGDTLRYVATVTDRRGAALIGATLGWSTENGTVATVDSAGFVVARRAGTTLVVARVGEHVARARIVVLPVVTGVEIPRDSAHGDPTRDSLASPGVLRVAEGAEREVRVRARDGRGNLLPRRAELRSSDTAVVAVGAGDTVLGRAPGRAMVVATVDGASDSVAIEVVPVPARLVAVHGDEQRLAAGGRLPEPAAVRVESRGGAPLGGVTVRFTPADAGALAGAVSPDSAVTAADGVARTVWTLGELPGRQRLVAAVSGLDSGLTLTAEADPVAANTRISAIDSAPSGPAGARLTLPVGVRVNDSLGRPLGGVPVLWSARGGGTIRGSAARTDSLGEAQADWTLGPKSGAQRAEVVVGRGRGVPPFILVAHALAGAAATLTAPRGVSYTGVAGRPLARAVVVEVADSAGNPVPDVRLVLAAASGSVPDSIATTDAAGRASIAWTLGEKAGDQHLTVRAPDIPSLELTARARAGAAANLVFRDPPSAARAGRPPRSLVRVLVTDVYGNPVARQLVAFSAPAGTVAPARAMTDPAGTAATRWTPGRKGTTQTLTASVPGTAAKGRVEVEVAGARR
ncbi:MAG TPA: hypothetical protein VFW66_01230 [Gemmatimonadales bacterium]|nr:hypothetical protein [Gemmatimonadales bacterium]